MKTMYILLITVLTSCSSCKDLGICNDESLTLNKVEFTGDQLRTDGFYYGYVNTDFQGNELYEVFIFNKNGVIMLPGTTEFEKMESYIITITNSNQQNTKFVWGLYNIDVKKLSVEHWTASQCGHPVLLRNGDILNDTTFVLKKEITRNSQGTKESDINQEFHFRHFDIKPDSTNNFIK